MTEPSPGRLTRRGFLVLGGGTAAIVGLGGYGLSVAEDGSTIVASSAVLGGGYPRMLGFRQSEMQADRLPYSEWLPIFAQFSGIIGKALQEERTDNVGPQTLDYFTRYKQQYPNKLVVIHLNGRARLPRFETSDWSPGWWLYRVGNKLTAPVGPEDTVLRVASTTRFKLREDAFGGIGDDIVIAPIGAGGKPDFTRSEQVRLAEIDEANKTLTVVRAKYGTSALSFPAGAYLAPHEFAGPWSDIDDRVWLYNLSTLCPPDGSGRRAVDALVEQVESWFGPGGALATFDGLQLDVFQLPMEARTGVDADCDGAADLAVQAGVDTYLQGQIQLTQRLRQVLGGQRYLITDGAVGQQPDTASVNGIETEGFPSINDYDIRHWSQALMTLELWRLRGTSPRLSYPLYKFSAPNDYPVSFSRFRLTLAAALATNSAVSWLNDPGGSSQGPNDVVVWDELVAGTARQPGWLGAPRGETVHLAERAPDLLNGAGVSWSKALVNTFTGPGVTFSVRPPKRSPILLVSRRERTGSIVFSIPDRALSGPDVVLAVDLLADRRPEYPSTIGRRCTVAVVGTGGELAQTVTVPTTWFHAVLGFHDIGPGPVQITFTVEGDAPLRLRGLRMFAAPAAIARGFVKGAVFANPSGHDVSFDVAGLFPGKSFTRIMGNLDQDPVVNDGRSVGSTLTLGPLDALVVRSV